MSTRKTINNKKYSELFIIIRQFFIQKFPEFGHKPSMKKIADTLGVPWHRVRDWAYGSKPGTSDILLLADTLGLSMRWLLGGDGDPQPLPPQKAILVPGAAIGATRLALPGGGEAGLAPALPEDTAESEAASSWPETAARCAILEDDLRLEREEMRRKDAELRDLHREHQRVLRENADLRERVARLEAQSFKPGVTGLSAADNPAA